MSRRKGCGLIVLGLAIVAFVGVAYLAWRFLPVTDIRPLIGSGGEADIDLPPGFEAQVFASGLDGPRFLTFGPDGVLHVADRGNGRIVSLPDEDGDGQADTIREFAANLGGVHSIAYHDGAWFAGVPSGIVRLEDSDGDGAADDRTVLVDDYPTRVQHRTRTVAFLPDGRMVVSLGSSCNVCREEDPRLAAVLVYDGPEATGERVLARGLRNAVGLAVHPETGDLWATVNGRDFMGDDLPPETIVIVRDGDDHGWPRCHGGDIPDPDFGGPDACEGVAQPALNIQAHSAPLGLVFYTGDNFPAEYRGDLFVAYHGSWNRSVPTGYKVVRIPIEDGRVAGPDQDFATGWLEQETGQASGRPVGLAVGPDGALYVSDDKGGFIYRIFYQG